MFRQFLLSLLLCSSWAAHPALAAEHDATRLGNPATRFADPLKTPDDLRGTLLSPALRADVDQILRQSGYIGDLQDFRDAVAKAEIKELSIPPGTLLPAMSTRLKGKPVLLHDVRWAGRKPIEAYEFTFDSQWRRYRVVTPKPCSNFWVEEVLPPPTPVLTLACDLPGEQPLPLPLTVCQRLGNNGNIAAPKAVLALSVPAGARLVSGTEGADAGADRITWNVRDLAVGASRNYCATFTAAQPGPLEFSGMALGDHAAKVESQCATRVHGIPAVLLEVVDLADPVLVGNDVVYTLRVLNQGSAPLTNIRIVAALEDSQTFLSGTGPSAVSAAAGNLAMAPLPLLKPGEEARWRVVVKAEKAADVRFAVELRADQFQRPINETEATLQY
jgi:hypothetical protein